MGATAVNNRRRLGVDAADLSQELTEWDQQVYNRLISRELTPEQIERIVTPTTVYPRQRYVLATHWHPEYIPLDLIRRRIEATFPNREQELIIPTNHNQLETYDGYTGVEVDCFSPEFNRKVQLLVHVDNSRLEVETAFTEMLNHTFEYRSAQLFEFWDTIIEPAFDERVDDAAAEVGADQALREFVRTHAIKVKKLFARNEDRTPRDAIKNKMLTHYFDALRDQYEDNLINHAQMFLKAIKKIVKRNFSLKHFYETQEVIEAVREWGGGIVVPHPEQFWPILLADYDVDGIEVWNPQSREFTEFLIHVVTRQNRSRKRSQRPILIFMGDDCHMSEKVRDPRYQDRSKAGREVGVQPAWDDLSIRKSLIVAHADRAKLIEEYKARLSG